MNLRQAAEALLNHWEAGEYKNCTGDMAGHIRVLREALAQSEQRPANFYLSPPQREWVGLPGEKEILEMSKDAWGKALLNYGRDDHCSFYVAFARAIETYLKEENT